LSGERGDFESSILVRCEEPGKNCVNIPDSPMMTDTVEKRKLNFRTPKGILRLEESVHSTCGEVARKIEQFCSIASGRQSWLVGYPPQAFDPLPSSQLGETPLVNGDTITVKETEKESISQQAPAVAPVTEGKDSNHARMFRRKIADDNSCLFNPIGYVLDNRNRTAAVVLRDAVAAVVVSCETCLATAL